MLIQYLILMLESITAMLSIYLIGKIILSFFNFNISGIFRLFSLYVVGLIAIILFHSIVKTKFITINSGLIPILFLILYLKRHKLTKPKFNFNNVKNEIFITILIFVPIYLYQSCYFFDFLNGTFKPLHTDHYLYADYTNSLKLLGVESINTDLNYYLNAKQPTPYHYSELWLTSFFSSIFKISTVKAYFLITIPVCASIFSVGIFSLMDKSFVTFCQKYIFSITAIFVSGVYFTFYNDFEITKYSYQADNNIISLFNQKLCVIYIFILFSTMLFIQKKRDLGFISLSIVPILSVSFAPSIIGGVLLWYFFNVLVRKEKISSNNRLGLLVTIFVALFIFSFYQKFKGSYSPNLLKEASYLNDILSNNIKLSDIKIIVAYNIYRFLRPFIFYLPYLYFIWIFIKVNSQISLLFLFILISGVFSSVILFGITEAHQFASNSYIIFNIIVIFGMSLYWCNFKLYRFKPWLVVSMFFAFVCINFISTSENKKLPSIIKDDSIFRKISTILDKENVKILIFLNKSDYINIPYFSYWQIKNDILPLTQYTNQNIIFSIGNPELYINSKKHIGEEDKQYYKLHLLINKKSNYINFIKVNNIKLLYVKKGVYLSYKLDKQIDYVLKSKEIEGELIVLKR
jgi:hypothetical protein